MTFALPSLATIPTILQNAAPAMPPELWGVTGLVVVLLILTAAIDAYTSKVPDILVLLGLVAVTGMVGVVQSWDDAADHLRVAIAAGILIWAVNLAWYKLFRRDALGMGDAKWTMLAVACFGALPAVLAWGAGAVLATLYIGTLRLFRRRIDHVTFAPFLLIGLGLGLYGLRFTP